MYERVKEFDPAGKQDPVRDLTLLIRGLRPGERVRMPNDVVVRSVAVRHGASMRRRFAVVHPGTPLARHRELVLGRGHFPTAELAARNVLGKE